MKYSASEPKFLWLLLLAITLVYASVLETLWMYVAYALSFFLFFSMLATYHVAFVDDRIHYQKKILGLTISKKEIKPDDIKEVTMVAAGRTLSLIHLKKGVRLKLHRFPNEFGEELESYAKKHQIPIQKPTRHGR